MHKESITKNSDMIVDHVQYKQPSEFGETHREESGISEFGRPYKPDYKSSRISTRHEYTELEVNPSIHIIRGNEGGPRTLTNNQAIFTRHI